MPGMALSWPGSRLRQFTLETLGLNPPRFCCRGRYHSGQGGVFVDGRPDTPFDSPDMGNRTQAGGRLTSWLEKAPAPVFAAYAVLAAFSTYFCMYAFRKPFAAAKFDGEFFLSTTVELKTAIVISQIIGYALSKYIGIKVCSEATPARRAITLVVLILWAELALLAYGLVPNDLKVIAIFFNGLPLGMVWGLVVWYLEGRRTSELLLAGLSCSYIVSSGIVKDIGRAMMEGGR